MARYSALPPEEDGGHVVSPCSQSSVWWMPSTPGRRKRCIKRFIPSPGSRFRKRRIHQRLSEGWLSARYHHPVQFSHGFNESVCLNFDGAAVFTGKAAVESTPSASPTNHHAIPNGASG